MPISAAKRFLDTASAEDVYVSSKLLLSAFLESIQAKTICFKYGMHPVMRNLMKKQMEHARTQRYGSTGAPLWLSDGDDESFDGDDRVISEPVGVAIETCSKRLAKLPEIPGVSRGIVFGIDSEPSNPDTRWQISFHRGPLPQLDIRLSNAPGFHPPDGWQDALLKSECAHVGRWIGSGDNIALSMKRRTLFPYSKGKSSVDAVSAGRELRRFCREAWNEEDGGSNTLVEESSWEWRRRRFIRRFDQALVSHAGQANLDALLKQMDTRLESWLAADS